MIKVYRNFNELDFDKGTVLTVGTFDGVHKGHQVILKKLLEIGKAESLIPVVLTIDPHPQIVLKKEGKNPVMLLTTIEERILLFEKFGIENLFIIPFTYEFSQTPPDAFIKEYLVDKFLMKKILIGYDHMFGRNREGNKDLLNQLSSTLNFGVDKIDALIENDTTVSSTKIRTALINKELESANKMLGYDYIINGIVDKGEGRGRTLGFPTANVRIDNINKQFPGVGVYLVSSEINGRKYYGMANLGTRPTFSNNNRIFLEVYYFDLDLDLYDKKISVSFLKFIRDEKKFTTVGELINQIKNDELYCRDLIKRF
ncbi:MAG: bifunctional riboflavin kinase/FAD synthetase [Bacteroidetes bacterium]|nr:MAG: bifunctional riboflavin kinase/FAD synthetase [Bacteroidota bacterium]